MRPLNRSSHDVVVVGARVAGSATAMLLARLGRDVLVVDQGSLPSDTVSTHSLARSGVVQLRRWGLLDEVVGSGAPPVRQVTFNAAGASLTRPIKHRAGVDFLVAPRRYVLDAILAAAAQRAGAEVRPGITVTGARRDRRGRVAGVFGIDRAGDPVEVAARYVVGADGLGSRVARSVGAALTEVRPAGGATQYAYYQGIPWTGFEFFVAPRSFAGVFPTHDGQACIWVCDPAADARAIRRRTGSREQAFGELLESSAPPLAERLRQARRTSPVHGMLRLPKQVRQAFGPGWALVGDAGYHRHAVTAYGISDAFRDAELLAVALDQALGAAEEETVALASYQQQRDQALREIFEITWRLAAIRRCRGSSSCRSSWAPPSTGRRRRWPPDRSPASTCSPPPDRRAKEVAAWIPRNGPHPGTAGSGQPPTRRRSTMTTTDTMRNGVDTATLFATLDAVKQAPRQPASSSAPTTSGSAAPTTAAPSPTTLGVGEERTHERTFVFDADHPAVLVGRDQGPTPWSSSCTPWPPASPPAWPTSPPPAA
jgi:flavin-dependent dehydrogenase